ncbi:polysaccharide biosynthesis/export family protein [Neptunitalea lumnitzerae]|nr:polysaccharide biosynthesis/export family protein [Neptunitalea sp. Y10]
MGLHSCISRKQLTYLQPNENEIDSLEMVSALPEPYRVQVNDVLNIDLKAEDPQLVAMFTKNEGAAQSQSVSDANLYLNGYSVDLHGTIRIPVLGEINVLGYTVDEIRKKIEDKLYDEYLTSESGLFVSVKLAGVNFTVTGEVGSPGRLTVFRDRVNIVEAIAIAGNMKDVGDRANVVIVRQYPGGTKIHHIDLTDANAISSPYYFVKPNDMIIINPLPQKSIGAGTNGLQTFTTIFSVFSVLTSTVLLIRTL